MILKFKVTPTAAEPHPESAKKGIRVAATPNLVAEERMKELLQANQLLEQEKHNAILAACEEERKRISQDLHDELGQYLTALKIDLGLLLKSQQQNHDSARLQQQLEEMRHTLDTCIGSVRGVVAKVRSPRVTGSSFFPELEMLFDALHKLSITVNKNIEVDTLPLDTYTTSEVYHILQEAITNIAKHAQATQVLFSVKRTQDGQYRFRIADNGVGFRGALQTEGNCFGLTGMQERASRLNASLLVKPNKPAGTLVDLRLPFNNTV